MSLKTETINMKVFRPKGTDIKRGTPGSAGLDIFVHRKVTIKANSREAVDTGMCFEIPEGNVGLIMARSSMAMQGVTVLGGVIDSDYRGPVKIFLANISDKDVCVSESKAIAQLVVVPFTYCLPQFVGCPEELEKTTRAAGGFGSTDRNSNDCIDVPV